MRQAVIVGGTSGIGLATARQLSTRHDMTVHVVGRDELRCHEVAAAAPELRVHRGDGADPESIGTVFRQVGTVDMLIVTLAGSDGPGVLADLDLAVLRRAFDAKFWGHLTTVQSVLPHLAPDGSITLLGAITARAAMPGTAGIAAINGAVEALVGPLAVELAPVRVNAVSPGLVDTPWWSAVPEDDRAEYFAQAAKSLPRGRVATADEVAESVVLAATNPNLTGAVLASDGGARLVSMS